MADQQLDVFDSEDEDGRLWEALSSFKKEVRNLVEMTGLSTNVLADRYGFGKGKVATWQNPKPEQPNIPPLRFVEVLIKEAQERENLQDGAAAVFLRQYGELLQLYCARAKPHNVHRQMLADYQNTLLIRRLNNATNAALEQIAELTEELETLRGDRDEEQPASDGSGAADRFAEESEPEPGRGEARSRCPAGRDSCRAHAVREQSAAGGAGTQR